MLILFQVGDVVKLKSGGLPMTICRLSSLPRSDAVECYWMDGGILHSQWLSAVLLELAMPNNRRILDNLKIADTEGM